MPSINSTLLALISEAEKKERKGEKTVSVCVCVGGVGGGVGRGGELRAGPAEDLAPALC